MAEISRFRNRMSRAAIVGLVVASIASALPARAGAWTPARHEGQLILNTLYYKASDVFDADGNRIAFADGGRFTKWEMNPYLEYGLRDDLALVVNTFARRAEAADSFSSATNSGFAESELALRYRLSGPGASTVWSVQALVKVPLEADSADTPYLANDQTDLEARLLVGRSFPAGARRAFWNVETAYRHRREAPADEIRIDATFGYDAGEKWQLLAQLFGIEGRDNGAPVDVGGNPTITPAFDLYKGQLSAVYRATSRVRLQGALIRDMAGNNTGAGNAVLAAVWLGF